MYGPIKVFDKKHGQIGVLTLNIDLHLKGSKKLI